MIVYRDSAEGIEPKQLHGFFVGWPNPPSPETHLRLLQGSDFVILAMDGERVVGFVTAITDKVLAAYIPHLEVLPSYQRRGIGRELMERILTRLEGFYMTDLLCDPDIQPFYEKMGMQRYSGMIRRRYEHQAG